MKVNFGQWRFGVLMTAVLTTILFNLVFSHPADTMSLLAADQGADNLAKKSKSNSLACPDHVEDLTALLLKNLPSYSNRVIQRTQDFNQGAGIENYIIAASEADFEPLGLPRLQYDQIDSQEPEQVFFTVLERKYVDNKIVDIQTYHWLFLTQTNSGWRTVMLFSRFGNPRTNTPPTPPRETTNGIIGQGIQLWLRDCRNSQ